MSLVKILILNYTFKSKTTNDPVGKQGLDLQIKS
jgi:hypothetical protein